MGRALLWILILCASSAAAPTVRPRTVGHFLKTLFAEHVTELRQRLENEWQEARAHGLPDTPSNRTRFLQAMFIFHLVRHGEILGNAFLIREDDGRHPDSMLRDSFSETPRYELSYVSGWQGTAVRVAHGEVFSYGRCDEFEMEESALLRQLFDLPARIAMLTTDHVVTEVPMEGGYLRLDSSFLRCIAFSHTPIVDAPPEDGVYNVARTNRIAVRDLHVDRTVPPAGATRIAAAMASFLRATERPPVYCRLR